MGLAICEEIVLFFIYDRKVSEYILLCVVRKMFNGLPAAALASALTQEEGVV